MAHDASLNIYQRLALVMHKVEYVQKSVGTGVGDGKGVARDVVVSKVRKHLLEAGIYVSTSQVSDGETRGLEKGFLYVAIYRTTFINVDKPDDFHAVDSGAHGKDSSDKGPGKARTYAEKMNIISALFLETGIDDEAREPSDKEEASGMLPGRLAEVIKTIGEHTDAKELSKFSKAALVEHVEAGGKKGDPTAIAIVDAATKKNGALKTAAQAQ